MNTPCLLYRSDDGEIMAVEHKKYNVFGVQFHPESIMTPNGIDIIRNFLGVDVYKRQGQAVVIEDTENIITPHACHHEITAQPLWVVLCLFCVARYINISDFPTRLIRLKFDRCRIDIKDIGRQA